MKKILLTAAAVAALSSSTVLANESDWFVKANIGASKIQKNNGFKSDTDGIAAIGFGYYFMDNLRADLTLDHLFSSKLKKTDATNRYRAKVDANALLFNVYADLADMSMMKFFVGAGAGVSRVGGKTTTTDISTSAVTVAKAKNENAFSYALHAGVSSEFDHGMHAELAYSFKDYGKKNKLDFKKRLVSHNVTAGIRFDI